MGENRLAYVIDVQVSCLAFVHTSVLLASWMWSLYLEIDVFVYCFCLRVLFMFFAHGRENAWKKMKGTKQSRNDHGDELTIEDVIELGGDQVSALYKLISVAIQCIATAIIGYRVSQSWPTHFLLSVRIGVVLCWFLYWCNPVFCCYSKPFDFIWIPYLVTTLVIGSSLLWEMMLWLSVSVTKKTKLH